MHKHSWPKSIQIVLEFFVIHMVCMPCIV